ncbi:hypothetical protein D3C81_1624320 [compost metagenome]
MLLSVGVASGARAAVCTSLVSSTEGTTVDEESVLAVLVTPALNLGLNPVGFDVSVAELPETSTGEDVSSVAMLSTAAEGVVASSSEEFAN